MNKYILIKIIQIIIFLAIADLTASDELKFGDRQDLGEITLSQLKEISGIVASRKNNNILWVHNDSGNGNFIYALTTKGQLSAILCLEGIRVRDCEDISIGPGPERGVDFIYLGDIGDNKANHEELFIYRFPEPIIHNSQNVNKLTIQKIDKIRYIYPDSKKDAETLIIDPINANIYIASKEADRCFIYYLPQPDQNSERIIAEKILTFDWGPVVAGDISFNGEEILLKTYFQVFYWNRKKSETIQNTLKKPYTILRYIPEPQGEAICWSANGDGYFTLSEQNFGILPHLYYYPRLK